MQEPFNINAQTKIEMQRLLAAYQQAVDYSIICSITDTKGKIIYVNQIFCEISKYTESELIGQNHSLINSGYHSKDFFAEMWRTIGSGFAWHGEVKNTAKDGTFYWVDTTVLPIKDNDGKTIQYFSLRSDITEKKRKEEIAKRHTASIEEMLHIISHKVRKPVTNLVGLMNIVEDEYDISQEELVEIVNFYKTSVIELDEFTKELAHFIYDIDQKNKNIEE